MTEKWIIRKLTGRFVGTEKQVEEIAGTQAVQEMKQKAHTSDWKRSIQKFENTTIECVEVK